MTLKEQELLKKYSRVLKTGEKFKTQGNRYILDAADWSGNSPHVGFLWARLDNSDPNPTRANIIINDTFISPCDFVEPIGEIVGVVNIFNGQFLDLDVYNKLIPNIPDRAAVVKLYHEMFPKQPWYKNLISWIKEKF